MAPCILVPGPFTDKPNTFTTKLHQGASLIHGDVIQTTLPLPLKVIVPIVAGESQVALLLTKPHEFIKLGHLLCNPGRDRVEALQAPAYIVIQAVGDSVLSLKRHGVSSSKSYGRLLCRPIDPMDMAYCTVSVRRPRLIQ
jgi:hypothetical protein